MTKTSKKKFMTTKQHVHEFVIPAKNEFIAKILASRGNNLHEVETADGVNFLASMPTKFRKTLWVRRGSYIILQPIAEGDKVRAEIVHVLDLENIEFLMEKELWPERFADEAELLTKRGRKLNENKDQSNNFSDMPSDVSTSCSNSSINSENESEDEEKNI